MLKTNTATKKIRKTKTPIIQSKAYENSEDISSVSIKELVKQQLAPIKESVNRLWQVMLGGFALLLTVVIYLHSDTKSNMKDLKKELKTEMKELKKELKTEMKELKTEINDKMEKIESKIDKLLQKR